MTQRGRYAGAAYSPDVKDALGAIAHELRDEGWTVPAVKGLFSRAGYAVGEETLRLWSNASGAGQPIISTEKKTGARKKLSKEQRQVAAGWVLREKKKSTAGVTVDL
jgi:hypothetical protein